MWSERGSYRKLLTEFVLFIAYYYSDKIKKVRWARDVARMGRKRIYYRILVGKLED
jgi:hypothetical protein